MSKLDISVSTSCLRFIALLVLCIIYVSAKNLDSISNYQYDYYDEEFKRYLPADNFFSLKDINSRLVERSSMPSDYDYQYGPMHLLPYKKRSIPIELQKALYAHGIVGRRR